MESGEREGERGDAFDSHLGLSEIQGNLPGLAQKGLRGHRACACVVGWGGETARAHSSLDFISPLQLIIIVNLPGLPASCLPGSISRRGAKFNVGPSKAMKSSSSSSSAEFIGCARPPARASSFIAPGINSRSRRRRRRRRTPRSKLKWTLSCLVSLVAAMRRCGARCGFSCILKDAREVK